MSSDRRPPVPPTHVAARRPGHSGARELALVAAGGALGGLARVALTEAVTVAPDAYPWATFLENVGGAFALALALTLLAGRTGVADDVRLLVGTGALGAFTTYSTFAGEVGGRLLDGLVPLALGYATASVVGGLLAAVAGVRLGRAWLRRRRRDPRRGVGR